MVHPPLDVGANSTGRKSTLPFRTGALLIGRISRWSMPPSLFTCRFIDAATATTIAGPVRRHPLIGQQQAIEPRFGGVKRRLGTVPLLAQIANRLLALGCQQPPLFEFRPQQALVNRCNR